MNKGKGEPWNMLYIYWRIRTTRNFFESKEQTKQTILLPLSTSKNME